MPIGKDPELVYTDNSEELAKACKTKTWYQDTSFPYRPETNGVAERAVRKVKEGTSCALVQSGFNVEWWVEAQTCFCFLYNVSEVLKDGFTPYELRFQHKFNGPIIPFGAELEYKPSAPNDIAKNAPGIMERLLCPSLVASPGHLVFH